MIQKHLTATVIIAVAIIIFHSSILNVLTSFLLAGVLPLVPVSLPSWVMFLLASVTLVFFMRWVVTLQTLDKKARTKNTKAKTTRPRAKPAS